GRWAAAAFVCALALVGALPAKGSPSPQAFVPTTLLQAAQNEPDATFSVIIQGKRGRSSDVVADDVRAEVAANPGQARGIRRRLALISGVAAQLTGTEIVKLAARPNILAITQDAPVRLDAQSIYTSDQLWPFTTGVAK